MNARIQELAAQARLGGADFGEGKKYYVCTEETFERFVELLVKESIEVMIKHDYHGEWLGEKLKDHFEIKS